MHHSIRLDDELLTVVDDRFDGAIAPAVYAEVLAALDDGVTRLVVDLCDAIEVDDGAVAVLAALSVAASTRGAELFVELEPGRPRRIDGAARVRSMFDAGPPPGAQRFT